MSETQTDSSEGERVEARPTCSCGHDRDHYMVSKDPSYTLMGSVWVAIFGISTKPIHIAYRCRRCNEVFDEVTEGPLLDQYL